MSDLRIGTTNMAAVRTICLAVSIILALQNSVCHEVAAAEGARLGFDRNKVEIDKKVSDERKREEKIEGREAWFKKSIEGKDFTSEKRSDFHDADRLLSEIERNNTVRDDGKTSDKAQNFTPKKKDVDLKAADIYKARPELLKNREFLEVERELDKTLVEEGGWRKQTLKDGNGLNYFNEKGGAIQLNKGYPEGLRNGGDSVHREPYVKISNGIIERVPLKALQKGE